MKLTQRREGINGAVECLPCRSVYWKPKWNGNDLVRNSTHLLFLFSRFSQNLPLDAPLENQYASGVPERYGVKGMVRLSVRVALDAWQEGFSLYFQNSVSGSKSWCDHPPTFSLNGVSTLDDVMQQRLTAPLHWKEPRQAFDPNA